MQMNFGQFRKVQTDLDSLNSTNSFKLQVDEKELD